MLLANTPIQAETKLHRQKLIAGVIGLLVNASKTESRRSHVRSKYQVGCPRCVMVKAIDCGIVISEFELHSNYYVQFRANTLGKGMNPLILPAMG